MEIGTEFGGCSVEAKTRGAEMVSVHVALDYWMLQSGAVAGVAADSAAAAAFPWQS